MKKFLYFFALIVALSTIESKAQYFDNGYNQNLVFQNEGKVIKAQYDISYDILYGRISISDLYGYDCYDLRILRNFVFAYYGYIFKDDYLRRFFNQFDWYYPASTNQSKVMKMMTKNQKANIDVIKKREKQLGC